ncbi:hypothetical protein AAFF_G00063790 [Aldrovandia affinis]|uniref:Uncharacterized protein n=1 Tax=Aldrovandia affinis TaxID=143900 RepID=A0AAD7T5C9_9TELE|nr:hypothetical protein AAFF_G00063790 [Aldrovandia affinis]
MHVGGDFNPAPLHCPGGAAVISCFMSTSQQRRNRAAIARYGISHRAWPAAALRQYAAPETRGDRAATQKRRPTNFLRPREHSEDVATAGFTATSAKHRAQRGRYIFRMPDHQSPRAKDNTAVRGEHRF